MYKLKEKTLNEHILKGMSTRTSLNHTTAELFTLACSALPLSAASQSKSNVTNAVPLSFQTLANLSVKGNIVFSLWEPNCQLTQYNGK